MCWARLTKLMANVKNFLFNSDYEQDKIIYFNQFDNIPPSDGTNPSLTTWLGLTPIPLVFGVWSTSSSFNDTRTFGFVPESSQPYCTLRADFPNIMIYNFATSPISARVYAFEQAGSKLELPATSQKASKFIFNTDYNYSKLMARGTLKPGQSFAHNLGYLPQVMAWQEYNDGNINYIEPYNYSSALLGSVEGTNYGNGLIIDNNSLRYIGTNNVMTIHYRVYYDQA